MNRLRWGLLLAAGVAVGLAAGLSGPAVPQVSPGGVTGVRGSGNAGYPPGATPKAPSSTSADTGGASISIVPAANQYAYVCGVEVNGLGSTAGATVTPAITGLTGGTFNFQGQYTFAVGATVVNTPFVRNFGPNCLQGNGLGTPIYFTVPGGGAGNTTTNQMMWGYVQ